MSYSLPFHVVCGCLLGLASLGCNNANGRPLDPGKPIVIQFLYDGTPIPEGAVDLSGMGGGTTLTPSGEAVFEHVPFGNYRVVVHPKIQEASVIPPEMPTASPTVDRPQVIPIPRNFRDEQATPLQIEVQADGPERFVFDLKKGG